MTTSKELPELTRQDMLAVLALGLMVAVSYFPALSGGFIWDDKIFAQNRAIREVAGLWNIWFSPGDLKNEHHYWPIIYTTFWLEHKLWGLTPLGSHLVNVALHLINSVLVWRVLRGLAVPWAWVAAALFAVHPVHVESVAWIIERKDVLSGLFYLTAVLTWVRFVETPRRASYVLALLLFVAGLLSKSIVVTLPVALLIVPWWKQGRVTATDLLRLAPFFVVALCITLADLWFYYTARTALSLGYSLIERVLIAARALCFYVGKLFWPTDLAAIYPLWDIRVSDPLAWTYVVAVAALAALLWLGRHRVGRGPLAGVLFFAVTLSPVLGFLDYGYMMLSFVADRYQYLAAAGVMAVAAAAAAHGARRLPDRWKTGAQGLVGVVLVLLGTMTWHQAGIYRDEITFFGHVLSLNPQQAYAHRRVSIGLSQTGRLEEGLAAGRFAVEQLPDSADAHGVLGFALMKLRRFDEAEKSLHRALKIDPRDEYALQTMGEALRLQGQHEAALVWYRAALQVDRGYAPAHAGMGDALLRLRRFDQAVASLREAVSLRPYEPITGAVHFVLGQALQELGRAGEAAEHYERALQFDRRNTGTLARLAVLRFGQKRYEEALGLYRALIEIDPSKAQVHSNVGALLYYLNRYQEALQSFEHALSLDPTLPRARAGVRQARKALQRGRR